MMSHQTDVILLLIRGFFVTKMLFLYRKTIAQISNKKNEMGFIIRDETLSFVEICSNFHDVVAPPNIHKMRKICSCLWNATTVLHD